MEFIIHVEFQYSSYQGRLMSTSSMANSGFPNDSQGTLRSRIASNMTSSSNGDLSPIEASETGSEPEIGSDFWSNVRRGAVTILPQIVFAGIIALAFGVAFTTTPDSSGESATAGPCWDKRIRIRAVADDFCRTIYINANVRTPFLVLTLYMLIHTYYSQIRGLFTRISRIIGLAVANPATCQQRRSRYPKLAELSLLDRKRAMRVWGWETLALFIWAAGTGFGTFYSGYMIFMYVNDSFYSLFAVQLLLSSQQLWINMYISALFARRSEAFVSLTRFPETLPAAIYKLTNWSLSPGVCGPWFTARAGSIACGMILFKLLFNFFVESLCGAGTVVVRNLLFILADVVSLGIIFFLDGRASAIADMSRTEPSATAQDWPLAALVRARLGLEQLFSSKGPKVERSVFIWHWIVVAATIAASCVAMWVAVAASGERLC